MCTELWVLMQVALIHTHTPAVTKFFNRLLALSVEAQHLIFEFYERIYGNELLNAKERGGHDACVLPRLCICVAVVCIHVWGCRTLTSFSRQNESVHRNHTNSGVMTLYANKVLGSEPDTLMYINGTFDRSSRHHTPIESKAG